MPPSIYLLAFLNNSQSEMRKRISNSEMNHYKQPPKMEDKPEIKKNRKKRSCEIILTSRKETKPIIQINPSYTAISQTKKKNVKNPSNIRKHSMNIVTKLSKGELKSTQLIPDRRCKSSLREKQSSKILNELIWIGKSLPIASKLNSLYSNTTSIYNSHNDLQKIQKKLSNRIPTQEPTEEIEEIRKYESLVLNTDRSTHVLRSSSQKRLIKQLPDQYQSVIYPQQVKTEEIITNYIHKYKAESIESQLEIVNPRSLEDINEYYEETSLEMGDYKDNSIENSLIDRLDMGSGQGNKEDMTEFNKLNEIIGIIEKNGNNLVQKNKDKEYIIQTIKDIIESKKAKQKSLEIQVFDKYEANEPKTKTFLNSSSINTSSLRDSLTSEADISVLNLEILDKALRERQQYLQRRLKKQLQKIQEQKEQKIMSEGLIAQEIERVTKWINHQIKEVHNTRTQLWKGFNVAKTLLNGQISDKNKEMLRCLSEKYIHKSNHSSKIKKQKEPTKQVIDKTPQKKESPILCINDEALELMEPRMVCDSDDDQPSQIGYSPLVQHDNLILRDLKFLSSNESNRYYEQESAQEQHSVPEALYITQQEIKLSHDQDDDCDRILARQRLNCQSPTSETSSYGAIIIERSDTFLFSSQKKEDNKFLELTIQDKQEICEFVFLDLCLQLTDVQGRGTRIRKSITQYIQKIKEYNNKQKGFKTNAAAIKEYLTSFINFLKSKPHILQEIHTALDQPMGPTAIQILRYMHTFNEDIDQEVDSYILTARMFDMFEDSFMRTVKIERYYEDEQRESKRKNFLKNAIHIHNKAIYDAYNEALDKDRPFGMWGQPFSWKKTAKFSHQRDIKAKNDMLLKRAQQTIEYSHYMCGFMADKQDCALKDNPQVTDSYIQQIRYDRLSQMLAKELQESEERMQFFDDEETQILVDMAQSIFIKLVLQGCSDVSLLL